MAYGGARGGGKSWAVRKKAALLAIAHPGIRLLIVRRSFTELRENHTLPLLGELAGIAAYKDSDKCFRFGNSSRIKLGYCDNDTDVLRYQGQEYDCIFIDEATQLTEYQFDWLRMCCRGTGRYPKRVYLTCNPGGVGHEWVKRLFIDRDYRPGERSEDYTFIPARASDNSALAENDPSYLKMLDSLPDGLRQAWRDGDWELSAGRFFAEFRPETHVCEPREPPADALRYVTLDYGLDMLAVLWIAVDSDGRAHVYRELYEPNLIISEAARRIAELSAREEIYLMLAPPDLWSRQRESGRTTAELFSECGLQLTPTGNNRIDGWRAVKEALKVTDGLPGLDISSCCRNLIRTLPLLQFDPHSPDDCLGVPHELTHAPDALRGFCTFRASMPKKQELQLPCSFRFEERLRSPPEEGYGDKIIVE